ncbi:MAG: hypothetical protein HZA14_12615 [Nitrospirae bacterium]|nr:hypothetical protein [Nitrospirota bacterium]
MKILNNLLGFLKLLVEASEALKNFNAEDKPGDRKSSLSRKVTDADAEVKEVIRIVTSEVTVIKERRKKKSGVQERAYLKNKLGQPKSKLWGLIIYLIKWLIKKSGLSLWRG